MYSSDELFQRNERVILVFISRVAKQRTQIELEWAQKQLVTRVYTLFYFLHDIANP